MVALGLRVRELRSHRPQVDLAIDACEYSGEVLTEKWIKHIEHGKRVSLSPWEVRALAWVVVPDHLKVPVVRRVRAEAIYLDLCFLAGWPTRGTVQRL